MPHPIIYYSENSKKRKEINWISYLIDEFTNYCFLFKLSIKLMFYHPRNDTARDT